MRFPFFSCVSYVSNRGLFFLPPLLIASLCPVANANGSPLPPLCFFCIPSIAFTGLPRPVLLRLLSLARRGVLGFDFRHFLRPLHIASSCSPYQSIRRHLRHVPLITIYSLASSHVSSVPATCLHATMRAMLSQDREPSLSKCPPPSSMSPLPLSHFVYSLRCICAEVFTR